LNPRYLVPERAVQLRLLRFQSVRAIAEVAKAQHPDFVLVAGDTLDDNGVGRDTLQQTSDALKSFAGILVGLCLAITTPRRRARASVDASTLASDA
jgi:hypothetical protein